MATRVQTVPPSAEICRYFLQCGEKECAPRKNPQKQQTIEEQKRDFTVVVRNALIEKAHELFVDEVGPEKALFGACRLCGIPDCRESVPRHSDDEKDESAR